MIDVSGELVGRFLFEANAGFFFYRLTCSRAGRVLGYDWAVWRVVPGANEDAKVS